MNLARDANPSMTTLRDRLRVDTAPSHERVDQVYSTLDLRRRDDLGTFLAAQRSVLGAVRLRPGPHAEEARDVARMMTAALDADLGHLGPRPVRPLRTTEVQSTACLYILLGSSLGTRVLHRRWLGAEDRIVAEAGRYLGLAMPPGAWRGLCMDLERQSSSGDEADRIVRDASALFDLHLAAWAGLAARPERSLHV